MSSALGAVGRRVACVSRNPPFESQLEWIENIKKRPGFEPRNNARLFVVTFHSARLQCFLALSVSDNRRCVGFSARMMFKCIRRLIYSHIWIIYEVKFMIFLLPLNGNINKRDFVNSGFDQFKKDWPLIEVCLTERGSERV